jgi:hypothetical protein
MEVTLRWLAGQKETPSFVPSWSENISSILDAPLPKSLRDDASPPQSRRADSFAGRSTREGSRTAIARPTIHDALIEKGKIMAMRREALQERALDEESRTLKGTPSISLEAQKIPVRTEPIESRLLRKAQEASTRQVYEVEVRKQQLVKAMQATAPFKPNISSRGKRAEAKVTTADYHKNWHRRREQRLESRRTELLISEMAELRDCPDINARSTKLAAAKREKEGLAGMSHIEAMLERDRLTKLAAWERSQRELESMANPQITVYAATLPRDTPAAERLYLHSFEAQERRTQLAREHEASIARSYSPRISKLAANTPRTFRVEDEIMQRHAESQAILEEKRRMQLEREVGCHQPAINPVSDAIAARLPSTAKERLFQPRTHVDPASHASPSASRARSTSVATVSSMAATERAEALGKYEERRDANLQKLKREKAEREMEECTFAPTTNRNVRTAGSVVERNDQWMVRRDMKLQEQRRALESAEVKDCTFVPAREAGGRSASAAGDDGATIYGGDGKPWGSNEFIQRMEEARRIRQEKDERKSHTPSTNWKPTITQPVEFQLGRSTPVRSLQRPSGGGVAVQEPNDADYLYRSESTATDRSNVLPFHGVGGIVPPSLWR